MKNIKNFLIISITAVFLSSGCLSSPLSLKNHKRFSDGFFSGFSNDVISNSAPEIEGEFLYLGTENGNLIKYNIKKKKIIWKFKSNAAISDAPLAENGSVFFGNSEGIFFSIDDKNGTENWRYKAEGEILSKPAVNPEGMLFFTSADGTLTALDKKSGEWLWHYKRDMAGKVSIKGISSPLMIDKQVVLVGFADGFFSAISQNDGSVVWEESLSDKGRFLDVDAIAVYENEKILIPTYADGLYCLDKSGKVLWRFERGGATSRVDVKDNHVYYASNNGEVYKIGLENGDKIWESKFALEAPTNPVLIDELLVFATYPGKLYVFDSQNGEQLWKYNLSGEIRGNILKYENRLLLVTSRGHMFIMAGK